MFTKEVLHKRNKIFSSILKSLNRFLCGVSLRLLILKSVGVRFFLIGDAPMSDFFKREKIVLKSRNKLKKITKGKLNESKLNDLG